MSTPWRRQSCQYPTDPPRERPRRCVAPGPASREAPPARGTFSSGAAQATRAGSATSQTAALPSLERVPMRSLGTSDRPAVRAISRAIEAVSSRTRARQFLRVTNRMGASPAAVLPFVQGSPNFRGRRFEGEEPSLRPRVRAQTSAAIAAIRVSGRGRPVGEVPVVEARPPLAPGELAVTWYGHATAVLEIDGARLLIDPVFSERVSPVRRFGPQRMHPVPGPIAGIPTIDAVLISHDHYDHLDQPSIVKLEQ